MAVARVGATSRLDVTELFVELVRKPIIAQVCAKDSVGVTRILWLVNNVSVVLVGFARQKEVGACKTVAQVGTFSLAATIAMNCRGVQSRCNPRSQIRNERVHRVHGCLRVEFVVRLGAVERDLGPGESACPTERF